MKKTARTKSDCHDERVTGRRRIDLVLSSDFVSSLRDLSVEEIRRRRRLAELEEVDLSYLRRLVQGRIDIVKMELTRRAHAGSRDDRAIVAHLADILAADEHFSDSGRFITLAEPSRVGERRRQAEALVGDPRFSEIETRNTAELEQFLELLGHHEREISDQRKAVQRVADECVREIARRAEASISR